CGARRMRVPEEERRFALRFDPDNVMIKTVHALLFGGLARYMKNKLTARGYLFPERVYGNLQSGRMSEAYFLYVLEHLGAGTNEIYFHPAIYNEDRALSGDERQCFMEFQALASKKVIERMGQLDIELINYFDLEQKR